MANAHAYQRRERMPLPRAPGAGPELFRSLLLETDRALRRAWADGRLPSGILSDDLIERTRAALAGETRSRPETIAEACNRLAALNGARAGG